MKGFAERLFEVMPRCVGITWLAGLFVVAGVHAVATAFDPQFALERSAQIASGLVLAASGPVVWVFFVAWGITSDAAAREKEPNP